MENKNSGNMERPVQVKNLSQLKKRLVADVEFYVAAHCRPEVIGQRRMISYADTTGFYSAILDGAGNKEAESNGGKGAFLSWRGAAFWDFGEDGICIQYAKDKKAPEDLLIAIRLI